LILTFSGMAAGVAMSFGAAALIERFAPLYTVTITCVDRHRRLVALAERSSARFTRHGGR